ncbi:MAG: methionyl aminopeptidase [Butyrivibrio sp.]|jgi:methionyl aminopeptidase|uniref:Methionine aminopeptidase n=1 Tax=Butyrivibrio hungatei TaxID=185008 RepID=A0A1G5F968_9FIRM|nr:methionyl aminopeptidase [Butyrivibrio hungatei]MBQ4218894.1 methionyl aminopeptidase [Butyrivibrio sp.]MBR4357509.1 methionyl aminopeptidase [Butyrivibrio sp.]MEE3471555.1 methionyl aminopeptidase [Butyrivibrio hungatei]SCY35806.1 methionyl aminopeptidase [Butyrivibrio hungatei]
MYKRLERNDPCWCGSGKKYKACHAAFDDKLIQLEHKGFRIPTRDLLKTEKDIEGIKKSAVINMAVLDEIGDKIRAGMTTQEIDDIVYNTTIKMGGIPADLNYEGFPKSVCTSINEEVCHGIPSEDVILQDGDIINVDCSTILDGYFSDSSRMFCIGNVSPEKKRLVDVTKECLEVGLKAVIPWTPIGDMGHAVHQHALDNGYTVVKEIGGHGCGKEFHEEPFVSYVSRPGTGMIMVPGMVFTIEPMVNMGTDEIFCDEENGWTVYTADLKPSAQWEVELLVTETGYELLCW